MKKLSIILILFSFAFLFVKNINGQVSPTSAPGLSGGMSLIPGLTCGNAISETPEARKCCVSQTKEAEHFGEADVIVNIFNFITGLPGGNLLKPVVDPILNIKDYALQLKRNIAPVPCPLGYPSTDTGGDCICVPAITPSPVEKLRELCGKYSFSNGGEKAACEACANAPGAWTGLGCIYGDTGRFLGDTVFSLAIGLAGIISLICILYAAFTLQTSQGNPEKIKKAQELLTSCIMGLMLILFSVFILRLIGVNILKIPGFG